MYPLVNIVFLCLFIYLPTWYLSHPDIHRRECLGSEEPQFKSFGTDVYPHYFLALNLLNFAKWEEGGLQFGIESNPVSSLSGRESH